MAGSVVDYCRQFCHFFFVTFVFFVVGSCWLSRDKKKLNGTLDEKLSGNNSNSRKAKLK